MVGLATIARLLAMELAATTGRSEREVIECTSATVAQLQCAVTPNTGTT